uniref:Uncharacterized protein n=1 Tax=Candidatus Methanogaster sp. ANME-2c ERB4 TaxID=2759911 RepID=A0A7G9YIZ5_9EURY|nr:hypothetical protein KNONPEEI_00017 [Methanosarcinales archaeon ANME-2c ERB4]QNO48162.1 hypothetical protein GOJLPIDM_00018 [Methanosarcinales archaeon ANME-2c ERB4]
MVMLILFAREVCEVTGAGREIMIILGNVFISVMCN